VIDIVEGSAPHAVWVESSLRKSQEHASFLAPLRPGHIAVCDVIVATLANDPAEWIGWCAYSGDVLAYVYVRNATRMEGVASELIATAAIRVGVPSMHAATWTRAADRLARRLAYSHDARVRIEKLAKHNKPWLKTERNT
jgi:hypothetical protein